MGDEEVQPAVERALRPRRPGRRWPVLAAQAGLVAAPAERPAQVATESPRAGAARRSRRASCEGGPGRGVGPRRRRRPSGSVPTPPHGCPARIVTRRPPPPRPDRSDPSSPSSTTMALLTATTPRCSASAASWPRCAVDGRRGDVGDLAEEVDDLLHDPHEVTGGDVLVLEDFLAAARPPPRRGRWRGRSDRAPA